MKLFNSQSVPRLILVALASILLAACANSTPDRIRTTTNGRNNHSSAPAGTNSHGSKFITFKATVAPENFTPAAGSIALSVNPFPNCTDQAVFGIDLDGILVIKRLSELASVSREDIALGKEFSGSDTGEYPTGNNAPAIQCPIRDSFWKIYGPAKTILLTPQVGVASIEECPRAELTQKELDNPQSIDLNQKAGFFYGWTSSKTITFICPDSSPQSKDSLFTALKAVQTLVNSPLSKSK